MTLILTEKPSVARDFAQALGCSSKNGHYANNSHIVTNCVGHLLELFEPQDYDPSLKTWSLSALPIIPESFQFKPIQSTAKQLSLVKKIIKENSFDNIIIATDAGREGEVIARLVLRHSGIKDFSRVNRFWSSEALTPPVVQKGLSNLHPSGEYDGLFDAGFYRHLSDWTVGMNFSRLLSLKLNGVFSYGRVQTAVLALICRRHLENASFKPKDYFQIEGTFSKENTPFTAILHREGENRFESKDFLLSLFSDILEGKKEATVLSLKSKKTTKSAPLLFNLTSLQRAANNKHGFPAQKTLDICQSLYEKHKCQSYPRTPSRVLGEANVDLVKDKISALRGPHPDIFNQVIDNLVVSSNRRVFDDSKLEDHHALIPLAPLPSEASDDEKKVFDMVLRSFAASFSPDYVYNALSVSLGVSGVEFCTKGREILSAGWTTITKPQADTDTEQEETQTLPDMEQGESIGFEGYSLLSKATKPKPHFTEATILAAMESPEKHSTIEDLDYHFDKDTGLGTQATRAAIIETLLRRTYIERQKKKLIPTAKGLHLFNVLEDIPALRDATDVSETARWETMLKTNSQAFFKQTLEHVRKTVASVNDQQLSEFEQAREIVSPCPKCGNGSIYEGKKSFYCSNYKDGCDFSLWKQSFGSTLNKTSIKALLSGQSTKPLKLKRKDGSTFTAALILGKDHRIGFAPRP